MAVSTKRRAEIKAMFDAHCAYCGNELGERWHIDHVEAVMRQSVWRYSDALGRGRYVHTGELLRPENERVGNYFPACIPCNIDKGCLPLEDWRQWLNSRIIDGLRKNCSTFRHAERFGRVTVSTGPLVFYFEKYPRA